MPGTSRKRGGKKVTPKKRAENKNSNDLTINDFANSPSGLHARLKKASTSGTSAVNCEAVYDSCDIVAKVEEVSKQKETRTRRKSKLKDSCENDTGVDYPLDLWFLISEYIQPESVGKFALICKSSNHVVKTAKFWFHMYKRYYTQDVQLPARLRPARMVRTHGLRACVIRALHMMYFSLGERIGQKAYLQQEEPHSLVKRRCCLMWHTKNEIRWYFYFKLKEITKNRTVHREVIDWDNERHDLDDMLDNVSDNPENGCRILRVSCLKYGMVPPVTGLTLQTVKVNLSPGFDHHRIQLSFGTNYIPKIPTQVIVLNGVVDLKVLDWWHPCYPHQDTVPSYICETTESWDLIKPDYLTV